MLNSLFVILIAAAAVQTSDAAANADTSHDTTIPAHLTLANAVDLFRHRGFDLLVAEAAVQDAEGDVRVAGAVPNPSIGGAAGTALGYTVPAANCAGCSGTAFNAQLSEQGALTDMIFGKRGLRLEVARAALQSARLGRDDAKRTLESLLKQQFLQTVLTTNALAFARDVQDSTNHTTDLFRIKYKNGAVSETDVARIETLSLEADQGVDSAIEAERLAKVSLAFLLGVRGTLPEFELDGSWIEHDAPNSLDLMSEAQLIAAAKQHRPDLKQATVEKQRASAGIDLAYRGNVPSIAIAANYNQQGTGPNALSPPTLTVGVSLPLPLFYQMQGEIEKAQADLRTQTIIYDKTEAQVAADVGGAFATYTMADSKLTRMRTKLLNRAARALELVKVQYDKGAASLLDLLDAQRTYITTNMEYFDNLNDYWSAVFQLEQAIAMELKS